jgi:hypothetical protein
MRDVRDGRRAALSFRFLRPGEDTAFILAATLLLPVLVKLAVGSLMSD